MGRRRIDERRVRRRGLNMNDNETRDIPPALDVIHSETERIGFKKGPIRTHCSSVRSRE